MPLTVTQRIARRLLRLYRDSPARWTKNALARTGKFSTKVVSPESRKAGCWCLSGALERLQMPDREFRFSWYNMTGLSVLRFNDAPETRFRDIQRVLRRLAEGEIAPKRPEKPMWAGGIAGFTLVD